MPKRLGRAALFAAAAFGLAGTAWADGAWETDAQAYTIRLENPKVRVLDVYYPAGYKVKSHTLRDRLVIHNTAARLRKENSSGRVQEFDVRVGEMAWEKADTMSLENIGSTEFRATFIEIK